MLVPKFSNLVVAERLELELDIDTLSSTVWSTTMFKVVSDSVIGVVIVIVIVAVVI